jgi:hypothetical protein
LRNLKVLNLGDACENIIGDWNLSPCLKEAEEIQLGFAAEKISDSSQNPAVDWRAQLSSNLLMSR